MMFDVICSPNMRARVFWVLSLFMLCAWSGVPAPLEEPMEQSQVATNQEQ